MKEENTEQLKQRIKDLEGELEASLAREDIKAGGGPLKRALLRTSIGKIAADPTSTIGKALRFPRTCLRIVAYPHLIKEIRQKNKKNKKSSATVPAEIGYASYSPFAAFEIVRVKTDSPRVNVALDSLTSLDKTETEALKTSLELAKTLSAKFRLILLNDPVDPIAFNKILESNKISKKALSLEFYSLPEQNTKGDKKYALEVGDSEIFINLIKATNDGD